MTSNAELKALLKRYGKQVYYPILRDMYFE
jgi:hypothetical protein